MLWMDSTTAMSKWIGVSVPQAIDHANAKTKRFFFIVGRKDIICEAREDGDEMDCRVGK